MPVLHAFLAFSKSILNLLVLDLDFVVNDKAPVSVGPLRPKLSSTLYLEVGSCLLLELIRVVVDLESVQTGNKLRIKLE